MTIFTDDRLLRTGLLGGTLSRHHGNMREIATQNKIYKELDINPERILHFHQTHSDTLIAIRSDEDAHRVQQTPIQDADAWLLTAPGWGVAIQTADCVPLFLFDEKGSVCALAHCGWRGVVNRLPFKIARTFLAARPDGKPIGWLGPHIHVCCFEVQEDVAAQFSPKSLHRENGKIFVNLNLEILKQLEEAGLNPLDVKTPYYCTCCDPENFFSWRRDQVRQNLLSFIYKPKTEKMLQ